MQVRALFSTMRSGSTMMLHCLSQHPLITCVSGTIARSDQLTADAVVSSWKRSLSRKGTGEFLFVKNTFDRNVYYPFPDPSVLPRVKPVFLFREPVQTINSIVSAGFMDSNVEQAIRAYRYGAFEGYMRAAESCPGSVRCMTLESLTNDPSTAFRRLFEFWEIPWHDGVVNWNQRFSELSFRDDTVEHRKAVEAAIGEGDHRTLVSSRGFLRGHMGPVVLSEEDRYQVEAELQDVYDLVRRIEVQL